MPDDRAAGGDRHVLDGAKCPALSAIHSACVCLLPFPALAGCLGNVRAGASGAQMAYILAVNASIISETGGPCGPKDCTVRTACMPAPGYLSIFRRLRFACFPQGPDRSDACVWPDNYGITDPGYEWCTVRSNPALIRSCVSTQIWYVLDSWSQQPTLTR